MNKKYFLRKTISELYNTQKDTCINAKLLSELEQQDIEELDAFHAQDVVMLELPDEYFYGIRADHFVIEFGWSELYYHDEGKNPVAQILITANHKGKRALTLLHCPKGF